MLHYPTSPSPEEFHVLARRGNLIPLIVDLVADSETPVSAFAKIGNREPCFLFESAEKNEESGRFSFIGFDPLVVLKSSGSTVSITQDGQTQSFETESDPLAELQKLMARFQFVPPPKISHFIGGAVGYIGYDVVRFFEPSVPIHSGDDLQTPEMMFMIARTMIIFDHRFRKLSLISTAYIQPSLEAQRQVKAVRHSRGEGGADRAPSYGRQAQISVDEAYDRAKTNLQHTLEMLGQPATLSPIRTATTGKMPTPRSNTSQSEFESMVARAKELIAAGDIFQVVLSQRFETSFSGGALDLYRCLRFGNPSPYMFCLKFGDDLTAIGSSPELHVRLRGDNVEIRPIAGTRPRGMDSVDDERLARELIVDPKERAEHVMLIDLGRNDLGRVAQFGSVLLTEQMVIERYSHVMHIVSHIKARLHEDKNAFDAVRATFPAGTVSGAPKIRAMQIIAELEKSRRGFYAGIVGYFGFDGTLDSCIALRSIVLKNGKAYFQTGAGIVADSEPSREYEETINKANAMVEAIARSRNV